MNFTFLRATGEVAFFRSDAEQANWTQHEMSLDCTFPYIKGKVIERGMIILFQDPATDDWQAYEVRQCQILPGDGYQQFVAENIAISELTDCHIQDKIELDNIRVSAALAIVLSGTGWNVGNVGDDPVSSGDINRGAVWMGVRALAENWNVYIIPRVTVNAAGISMRYLDIIPSTGIDRGLRLAINKNVTDPCVTYDDTDLYTALYGYGGSYTEGSGDSRQTKEYTFESVVWSQTADHPAKPAGQKYIEYPEKTALFGRNGRPRFGYYQNTAIKDPNILLQKTWESLKECCDPKISITGTVTDLKRFGYADVPIRLYDMAIVELEPLGLLFYKQVIQLTVDLLDPTQDIPTIGDYIPNIIFISRETENIATGGGKGRGSQGMTKLDQELDEYRTSILDNGRQIDINTQKIDKQGNILQQAGMIIDPVTGVLIYAEDTPNMVGSKFHVTNNKIESEIEDRQTEDRLLSSRITQNANSIQLEVSERQGADNALSSRITMTATEIRSEVSDVDNRLGSRITQNANSITAEVNRASAAEGTLSGRITVNESSITQEVTRATGAENTLSGRITTEADRISLVVSGSGSNARIRAAQIVASVNNQTGQSIALIDADRVLLGGTTTIDAAFSVTDYGLNIQKSVYIGSSDQQMITLNRTTGSISCQQYIVPNGKDIEFRGSDGAISLDYADVNGMIVDATVSGNTLTLTKNNGDTVNFSKATTLNGSWGSGTGGEIRYRVVASPQGNANYATVFVENGIASKNTNWQKMVDIPVKIRSYVNGSETAVDTGYENTLHVNVSDLLQDKTGTNKITSNGTYTPDSDHIGFGSVEIAVPTGHMDVKTQFNSSSDGYYIASTDGSGGPEIANSSSYYQLGTSGSDASTKVQVQNTSGTRIGNTPELSVGSLYTNGQNSVNIIKGSWDTTNARIQFSKSAGTANTQGVQVGASGTWSNGNFSAPIKDYYDNPAGVDTGYTVSTDIGSPSTSNPSAQPSTASIAGRTQVGTSGISKAGLSGPGYIFFSVTVRGRELKYYITVNP